jgi:hypothetical protein
MRAATAKKPQFLVIGEGEASLLLHQLRSNGISVSDGLAHLADIGKSPKAKISSCETAGRPAKGCGCCPASLLLKWRSWCCSLAKRETYDGEEDTWALDTAT